MYGFVLSVAFQFVVCSMDTARADWLQRNRAAEAVTKVGRRDNLIVEARLGGAIEVPFLWILCPKVTLPEAR
jgi:hypothetical protein